MSKISEAVAAANDIVKDCVEIPSWGVTIEVRGMNGLARAHYFQRITEAREENDPAVLARIEAEILVQSLYDPEDGSLAFADSDIDMLLTKDGGVIGMLSKKALVASGLDADAESRLGKSSSASSSTATTSKDETPSDASTSSSPTS